MMLTFLGRWHCPPTNRKHVNERVCWHTATSRTYSPNSKARMRNWRTAVPWDHSNVVICFFVAISSCNLAYPIYSLSCLVGVICFTEFEPYCPYKLGGLFPLVPLPSFNQCWMGYNISRFEHRNIPWPSFFFINKNSRFNGGMGNP